MAAKNRPAILIILALIVGVFAAYMAQRWLQQRLEASQAEVEAGRGQVVVASKDIEFGETLEERQIRLADWPAEEITETHYRSLEAATGKVASSAIFKGEPITVRRAVDASKSSLLATRIGPNKRAVTVKVNEVAGVAGFLLPGSRVDVLAARKVTAGDDRVYRVNTVLQNISVLAVDQRASSEGEEQVVVVDAVTLEVTPKQAEKLFKATRDGKIQLVLRNPKDDTMADVAEYVDEDEFRYNADAQVEPPPELMYPDFPQSRQGAGKEITVIRGTFVDSATVKK